MHPTTKHLPVIALSLSLSGIAAAQEVKIPAATETLYATLATAPAVKAALDFLKADDASTLADQKAIVVIASPTSK